jgi:hypothetical protein
MTVNLEKFNFLIRIEAVVFIMIIKIERLTYYHVETLLSIPRERSDISVGLLAIDFRAFSPMFRSKDVEDRKLLIVKLLASKLSVSMRGCKFAILEEAA